MGRPLPVRGFAGPAVVYIVWGSTYLAIRPSAREMALILLGVCGVFGEKYRKPNRTDFAAAAAD